MTPRPDTVTASGAGGGTAPLRDLPALRPGHLAAALRQAACVDRAVVTADSIRLGFFGDRAFRCRDAAAHMSAGNPLVAGPVDTATPFSGAGLLDSGTQLADAIESGSWIDGGLAAFSVAADTAATVMDPIGSLIGAGLGWLMDHFEPLKGWLNDLTGDAGEVQAFAQTWANVAQALAASGDELTRILADVDAQAGEAMDAYRRFQTDAAAHIHGAGQWAHAMSVGLGIAGTIVQVVHDLVRDTLAQLVGAAIAWVAEIVFSFGLATPWVVAQVSTRVASVSAKLGTGITKLVDAAGTLAKHLDELKVLFTELTELLTKVLTKAKSAAHPVIEAVAAAPGIRRLDPRRNKLIRDMQQWADDAAIPGYKPFGDLSGDDFVDTHLNGFTRDGYPDWRWPGDNGFDTSQPIGSASSVVGPGDVIDRIAPVKPHSDTGEYTSPPGTPFPSQSLPPDRLAPAFQHHQLEIVKPLPPEVKVGSIAPDFQQLGGGVQYHFPGGIKQWVDDGYLRPI